MWNTPFCNAILTLSLGGLAALATACGDSGSVVGDGSGLDVIDLSDAGSGDASGVDTGPELTPCTDNTECRGGEVCREGYCREACSEADPCVGELAVCDAASGLCVSCLVDGDCGPDERCEGTECIFWCTGDRQCPEGSVCAESTGQCVEADCTADVDCSGGFTCVEGLCTPIDPLVCEPDSSTCDGDTLVRCNGDGTAFSDDDCAAGTVCVEDAIGARCATPVCTPNDVGCLDASTAYLCNPTGTVREPLACPEGRACLDGACVPQVCGPGTTLCDGETVLVCNASGTELQTVACALDPACASSELGCVCSEGECVERVCEPGSGQCVGSGVRRCSDDGLAQLPIEDCAGDEACYSGECLPTTCTPGQTACGDSNTLLTCRATGGWRETDCAASGTYCDDADGSAGCATRVCEPGSAVCNGASTAVVRCNSTGSATVTEPCSTSQYCTGGVCAPDVCTPDALSCVGGNVQRCNALGSGFVLADDCTAAEECEAGVCVPAGGCSSSIDCAPRDPRCEGSVYIADASNGTCRSRTCDYTAVEERVTCGAGTVCTLTGCASSGTTCSSTADCASGQTCGTEGRCLTIPTSCTSDTVCRSFATATGYDPDLAFCDPSVGCYLAGVCETSGGLIPSAGDPFNARCSADTSCGASLTLFTTVCQGCTVGDDSTCRADETCVADSGGLPFPGFGGDYCAPR